MRRRLTRPDRLSVNGFVVASQAAFPPWHGMQYMRDQFSGLVKLTTLDNGRYPDVAWTSVKHHLRTLTGMRS
jgi:hypothetical protein